MELMLRIKQLESETKKNNVKTRYSMTPITQ